MKKYIFQHIIVLSVLAAGISSGYSQTFTVTPGTVFSSSNTVTETIAVTGVGNIDCTLGLTQVCVDVSHAWVADITIRLIDPAGDIYVLTSNNGGGGNNYSVTCFDMNAATAITAGSAPYNGSYIPENDFGAVNNGQNANANWRVRFSDNFFDDDGTINSISLVFGASPSCPPAALQEDCGGGVTVCNSATFTGNSSGSGNVADLDASNRGCLGVEHESSWYYAQASSAGTFVFEIITTSDYDFAVWGPLATVACPPVGAPLRCSFALSSSDTGLQAGSGDTSEDDTGDGYVDPITANAGEIFIILIDNFSTDGFSFDLNWTLSAGANLDCTPLPVVLTEFNVNHINNANKLQWYTKSEANNDFYTLEKSADAINWEVLTKANGAGNSSVELTYTYWDNNPRPVINYYRLSQTDFDGKKLILQTTSIDNSKQNKPIVKIVNILGQEVSPDFKGLKIIVYSDGSYSKVISSQ